LHDATGARMTRKITVAAIQTSYGADMKSNIDKTVGFIEQAAQKGAQVILPSELFQGLYFCNAQEEKWFETAFPATEHPCVTTIVPLCKKLNIAVPVSIFERDGHKYYNSMVMVDASGEILGVYRKSHIPDGPGFMEKYYFRPGDTGFKVWDTKFGKVGVGICWDQWYPECARAMMLQGAEILMYPTAIGSEPHDPSLDTAMPWQRAMQGHAVSNIVPVIAANRIGTEKSSAIEQTFYGHSFVADHRGDLVQQFGRTEEGVLIHSFDLDFLKGHRAAWGFFRDRRTDLYGELL
jgi:N-carbamoylputrescine amidase